MEVSLIFLNDTPESSPVLRSQVYVTGEWLCFYTALVEMRLLDREIQIYGVQQSKPLHFRKLLLQQVITVLLDGPGFSGMQELIGKLRQSNILSRELIAREDNLIQTLFSL
jgi:hypothetical protein